MLTEIKKFKDKLALMAGGVVAAFGILTTPNPVQAVTLPSQGELLVQSGKRSLPTIATEYVVKIFATSNDPGVSPRCATELFPSSDTGVTCGALAISSATVGETAFSEGTTLITPSNQSGSSLKLVDGVGDNRAVSTFHTGLYQGVTVANSESYGSVSEFASVSIKKGTDPVTGDLVIDLYGNKGDPVIAFDVNPFKTLEIHWESASRFSSNLTPETKKYASQETGLLIGFGTAQTYNPEAVFSSTSPKFGDVSSDSGVLSFTAGARPETVYLSYDFFTAAFIAAPDALRALPDSGLTDNIYRAAPVPEASTSVMFAAGLACLAFLTASARRRGGDSNTNLEKHQLTPVNSGSNLSVGIA